MTHHFKMHGQTDEIQVKSNVETGNGILSNYHLGIGTQQRRQNIKTVNVAVDLFTNLHAVANGGDLSLEYHHGAFLRSLKI